MQHTLYTRDDPDAPDAIKDTNGDIVLALCKVCGGGEATLTTECPAERISAQVQDLIANGQLNFENGRWASTCTAEGAENDIADLMRSWERDPCWDLEAALGFEAYQPLLLAHRLNVERSWKAKRLDNLERRAAKLGVPGNLMLAQYVETLEARISSLEEKLEAR